MKLPVYSYTFLNCFEICPKQAFHRFVLRDIKFTPTEAITWGVTVHDAMDKRIGKGVPLPAECARYEYYAVVLVPLKPQTEMKLAIKKDGSPCSFFDDDVWLRGKADVAIKQAPAAMIADWKTGKRREDSYELELHGLMLKAAWPEIEKITGHYVWLADGVVGRPHDLSNFGETWDDLLETTDEIEMCFKRGEWRTKQGS